ncbi:MAG: DUF3488 and transglutaminase-like domain-containing protein, partial [Actinomycetota bacterium]
AASCSVALSLRRPKLALLTPLPLLAGAAILQPQGAAALSGGVTIALLLAGLAVSYGADLAAGADASAGFERRRLAGGAVVVLLLVAGVAGVSRAGFLFPDQPRSRVVPPQRPAQPLPQPDRVLFTVESRGSGPWRFGVLDEYDGTGWLLPPFDESRFRAIPADGTLGAASRATQTATFRIAGLGGHLLPVPASPLKIEGLRVAAQIDPRTGALRLPDERVRDGFTYTIEFLVAPTGRQLSSSAPPSSSMRAFLGVPAPPNEVLALLENAPENLWDRLQFARARFYQKVVAAGAGIPADVPPRRVVEMLGGGEATPWEITAAEALLARWAGVPARIGYGFHRGDRPAGDAVASIRPKHGATWLEVWFEGYGWVPVVGTPPRARSSLNPGERNENPNVRPSDELALVVHVPVRRQTVRLLYVVVRYWAGIVLPVAATGLLVWWLAPGLLKIARRSRRRRWAARHGPPGRIAASYAELRDVAADLGVSGRAATPLAFADVLAPDEEHQELSWLVTRALWGDLRRDLRDDDAEAAEAMTSSIRRRLLAAQSIPARVAAFASRTSLREPYAPGIPNLWPSRRVMLRRRRRRGVAVTACLALSLLASACTAGRAPVAGGRDVPALPGSLNGLMLQREPVAEHAYGQAGDESLVHDDGLVYTVRRGDAIEGYVQVARFKAQYSVLDRDVREGVLGSIGAGRFRRVRLGTERVWTKQLPEQRMHLWFTPDGASMI